MAHSDKARTIQVLEIGILILTMLLENANSDEGLSVKDIRTALLEEHNLAPTEKTVRSHLQTLSEVRPFGLEIRHEGARWQIEPLFDVTQLRLLVDALPETGIASYDMHSTIERLRKVIGTQAGESIKFLEELDSEKVIAQDYQLTVKTLDEAIARGCTVAYQYLEWNAEGKLAPSKWGDQVKIEEIEPIQMVNKDGIRYVVGVGQTRFDKEINEAWVTYLRVDRMHEVKLLPDKKAHLKDLAMPTGETLDLLGYRDDCIGNRTFPAPLWGNRDGTFRVRPRSLDHLFDEFPNAKIVKTIPEHYTYTVKSDGTAAIDGAEGEKAETQEETRTGTVYSYEAEVETDEGRMYDWLAVGCGTLLGPERELAEFKLGLIKIAEAHGITCSPTYDELLQDLPKRPLTL